MTPVSDIEVAKIAGQFFKLQEMMYSKKVRPERISFQLKQLIDKEYDGIVAQLPVKYRVRAPGSLSPTLRRLSERGSLDRKIPESVIDQASVECQAVPQGTVFDVVDAAVWMLRDYGEVNVSNKFLSVARALGLQALPCWLPFALVDQDRSSQGCVILRGLGSLSGNILQLSSAEYSSQMAFYWDKERLLGDHESFLFVRPSEIPAGV